MIARAGGNVLASFGYNQSGTSVTFRSGVNQVGTGYTITTNGFWSFYYTAAGLHAFHVIAGAIIMAVVARDAARGRHLNRVENIGIYWHFVDVVWIFLFPLLYIAK